MVPNRHAGKFALVTGAGSGIGAAISRVLVEEGAQVTGLDVDDAALMRTAANIGNESGTFRPVVGDVANAADRRRAIQSSLSGGVRLDIVVNSAAVFMLAGIDATDDQWRRTLEVNLQAPAQLAAEAVTYLRASQSAAIVNIASISAHVGQADRWTYNAAKGGIIELTRCQALDLAPIRVNSVSPGWIWTEVLDRAARGDRPYWEKLWGSYCPLSRCGEPREVAGAVSFLASDEASFISGADLAVDGGYLAYGPEGTTGRLAL